MCKDLHPVTGLMNAYRNELHKFLQEPIKFDGLLILIIFYFISESSIDNHEKLKEMQVKI